MPKMYAVGYKIYSLAGFIITFFDSIKKRYKIYAFFILKSSFFFIPSFVVVGVIMQSGIIFRFEMHLVEFGVSIFWGNENSNIEGSVVDCCTANFIGTLGKVLFYVKCCLHTVTDASGVSTTSFDETILEETDVKSFTSFLSTYISTI